ncbi:DUF4304 domain-containing protein [Epilithonimonas zeae]|uniref:DUF4304 domain-containing protein n=1 Tax=Epilithonimonas zeae TaxID=1416779 RepID=A0A1N6GF93_9FLAO|nr:DUF4304 domain-containing protein [Epilithonimonas zeae]SIO06156.1 protein of unknown function [Epilithonimonas zeae]
MKEKFNNIINGTVKPLLKSNGFSKKGLDFLKKKDDLIFIINFQKSRGNSFDESKFYINCGIHSTIIDQIIGRKKTLDPKEYECHFRSRISTIIQSETDRYSIVEETDLEISAENISSDLKAVINLFDSIKNTNDLTDLMIAKNGLNNYEELFEFLLLTDNWKELKRYIQKLFSTFGQEQRWTIFQNRLSNILLKHNRRETISDLLK